MNVKKKKDFYTVYERCQYINCKNGKHNDYHLFKFPLPLDRLKIWIENCGNENLQRWKPKSLRHAGLCCVHFREIDYFQGKSRLKLRVNRNPIHWKEAEKMKENTEKMEADIIVENVEKKEGDKIIACVEKMDPDQIIEYTETKEEDNKVYSESVSEEVDIEENTNNDFEFKILKNNAPVKTYTNKNRNSTASILKPNNCCISNKILVLELKTKIYKLEQKLKEYEQIIKIIKKRNYQLKMYRKKLKNNEKNFSIDDFLNKLDISTYAKAMIKMQLREIKAEYSQSEKDLAKQMYFYSNSYYSKLRSLGLHLPHESTVRVWKATTKLDVVTEN